MSCIKPRCLEDKGDHFVSAEGYWHPCCVINGVHKTYFMSEEFKVTTGSDFHKSPKFLQWVDTVLSDYTKAPFSCKAKCGVDHIDDNKFYVSADDAEFFFPKNSTS